MCFSTTRLFSLALYHQLTEKSVVNKLKIHPALVNSIFEKSRIINPSYSHVIIDNEWEGLSKQSELVLWKLLVTENARESNNSDQTDSKERDLNGSSHFPPTPSHCSFCYLISLAE